MRAGSQQKIAGTENELQTAHYRASITAIKKQAITHFTFQRNAWPTQTSKYKQIIVPAAVSWARIVPPEED